MGAVEQRGRAQRVEPLLDHGGTDVLAARVVAVVDREERPQGRHRGGGERPWREDADAGQVGRRQPAADLGLDAPVRLLEEDGCPVALEQDHGVIDQAGQDPVEVEPAADIAGDAAQRLGSMEEMGDLVRAAGTADDRAEPIRHDAGDLEIPRTERVPRLADDQQDAPRSGRARDRHGQLGPMVGEDGERRILGGVAEQEPRQGRPARAGATRRELERAAEDAVSAWQIDQAVRSGEIGTREGARCQSIAAQLVGNDQVMAVRLADRPDDGLDRVVGILVGVQEPADRGRHLEVESMTLGIERVAALGNGPVAPV